MAVKVIDNLEGTFDDFKYVGLQGTIIEIDTNGVRTWFKVAFAHGSDWFSERELRPLVSAINLEEII